MVRQAPVPLLGKALDYLGRSGRWRGCLVARLDEIPGISLANAYVILAEIGTDMTRFHTSGHLVSWARLAPGIRESARKKGKDSTGHGNAYLAAILGKAAA